MIYGGKSNVFHLHVFWGRAFVHIPYNPRKENFSKLAELGRFNGIDQRDLYKCYSSQGV